MRKNFFPAALFAALLIAFVFTFTVNHSQADEDADDPNPAQAESAEFFRDKVVGVVLKGADSDRSNSWFTEVRLVNIEGRKFLVGKMYLPETKEYEKYSGYRNAVHGYAWEEVSRFRTMTVEQFDQYVKEWKKSSDNASESVFEKY